MHCGPCAAWRLLPPLMALLCLPACLVVVSTGPTSLAGATIVFVAVDDRGALIASLNVSVVSLDQTWSDHGLTASDGAFRCQIGAGVTRVRAAVTPPTGYVLSGPERWPREVDVSSGGRQQIEVRVQHVHAAP
jgi:hypothetical protein